ncbi:calcium/sodium antiporter [Shewanella sp. KX20019]|uniref:calcium/sodium antiporter n=1 Tax=Shewanella sp. KX20019 TaxID=2803864 RepID=UPI0019277356|nr:calcium/sodium antiporter [Shewanella sp. KX20019]QQX79874.1 calcium/sodium antiporter [Shewanella sp. KX20019]
MFIWLSIIGGFVILTVGAESLVRGASNIALKLGLSPLIIGLTIVAFGTSAPELAVSIKSAVAGNSGIALGNVIGSNIANIGLILGITALIRPIKIESQMVKRDIPIMIAASVLFWGLLLDGGLSFTDGAILSALLIAYLSYSYFTAEKQAPAEDTEENQSQWLSILFIIVGISMLVGGGILFVDGAVALAQSFGISEIIIGLTIVAIGTSMPELVTSIVAALKGQSDIAIGNVVGSNLFNILGILGVTAVIHPIIGNDINSLDWLVMIGLAALLLPFAYTGLRIGRREGSILVLSYLLYIGYLISQA